MKKILNDPVSGYHQEILEEALYESFNEVLSEDSAEIVFKVNGFYFSPKYGIDSLQHFFNIVLNKKGKL